MLIKFEVNMKLPVVCYFRLFSERFKEVTDAVRGECRLAKDAHDFKYGSADLKVMFDDVATERYYRRAIDYIKMNISHPHFYVFSDDPVWCKAFFRGDDFYFVDNNVGANSRFDIYLMSLCQHHINANSTFSWWAAWLSQSENTITIVPKEFIRGVVTKDIYPDRWIKI